MAMNYSNRAGNDALPPMPDQSAFGNEKYYDGFDPEKGVGQTTGPGGRKMSRIDRPVTKSISGSITGRGGLTDDDATDPSVSVGKQMELESGNAIQYRTCSWYKVCIIVPSLSAEVQSTSPCPMSYAFRRQNDSRRNA